MEQLYLEFDKEEFEKNLELFKRLQDEKNGDLEEAFTLFADKYINGEMDLPVFLQVVNNIGDNIDLYRQLLKGIEKVKKYVEKIDCKVGIINIYELLIYYHNNSYELSKELLSIDKENKIAKIILAKYGEIEYKKPTQNFSTYDLAILYNKLLYCKDDYMYYDNYDNIDEFANYLQDIININEKVIEKDIENSEESYFWKEINNYYAPDFKSIQSDLGKIYHIKYIEDKDIKNYEKAEKFYKESINDYINVDILFCHSLYNGSNLFTDENGNKVDYIFVDYNGNKRILKNDSIWDVEGNSLGDIDEFDYIMFDLDDYVVNDDGSKSNIPQIVEDSIICLAHLYYEKKEYMKVRELMILLGEYFIKKFYYYRIMGWNTYKINECKETAKESLEYLQKSIIEFNIANADYDFILFEPLYPDSPDPINKDLNNSLFNHMKDALTTIKLMYKMQKRGHIDYNAAKESLSELYFYNSEDYYFNLYALSVAFEIEDYEHCSKIAYFIIKNIEEYNEYNIDYKKVLKYLTISLHKLNEDNSKNLLDIFNNKDFNNYEYIIKLINECAGIEVLNKSVKIKNKKVLISLYEIMSVSRKELIVIRLLDYVRNEHDKNKDWKDNIVEVKYKEKKYKLHYNYHCFKGKEGYNNNDYIAINQIRDTLSHSKHKCEVNKNVKEDEKAREFIEANFTSIIECLFNVIKENGLLTDDKFNSEDF